ncbi:MAG: site-specific integrase [Clostridiales bacterium]|nr:site-specific integrase [Clostridiales bacterium]
MNSNNAVYKEKTSLWNYWDEFKTKYLRTGRSEVTVSNVFDALKFISNNCGIITIEDCNNQQLLEDALFEIKEKRHFSNVTYNSYLKNLNTYFIWLEKQGYIASNNLKKVARCKEEINEQYTLIEEQVKLIVAQVHERRQTRLQRLRNVFFVDLLRFTGGRPCELLNIQCKHIKEEGNTYKLVIQGRKQKGRPRYYRFPSWLRDSYVTYMDHRATLRQNETYVFISSSKQGPWTDKGMRGLFKKLSNELGFRVNAYAFRRFVATHLNEKGAEIKDIQQYLGHTRATTTLRYIERSCVLTDVCAGVMGEVL